MEVDFSPMEPIMNELLLNLLIVLGIPFLLAMIVGWGLRKLRIPGSIVAPAASLLLVYLVFYMFRFNTFE
ncbi:hypothetical protein [Indiicoccus explosivorum]|uniref:hypothetical protein n=1 Tax=Indiicoccus explosivorum TaxID=1917864 RepID=UPI001185ED68|nr:hypothetical protein [Indiicoccus explosivorum]